MEKKWERLTIAVEAIKNGYIVQANITDERYDSKQTSRVYCAKMVDVDIEVSSIVDGVDELWASLSVTDDESPF